MTVANHKRISVLVADHDRWARRSVASVLSEAGFTVEEASNGVSALRIAAASVPHLVLIGGGLPEIATADVVRSLRNNPRTRHTAVVEFRTGATPEASEFGAGVGADVDGHVDFPCGPIELLATVVNALEARHSDVLRGRAREASVTSSHAGRVLAARQPVARDSK